MSNTYDINSSHKKKPWALWKSFTLRQKSVLVEALLFLALAKLAIKILPFKQLAKRIGSKDKSPFSQHLSRRKLSQLRLVRQMVGVASRNVLWSSVCLDQAIAAKWMLKCRKISSTLHFGVLTDEFNSKQPIKAHAWLMVNKDFLVTGWVDSQFKEIAVFT